MSCRSGGGEGAVVGAGDQGEDVAVAVGGADWDVADQLKVTVSEIDFE